jgi:exodeoxyribonuclease-1
MSKTLYFYDLETTGFNPREARIMQFAGQRTDLDMKPIGEPQNLLVKLTNEILPSPEAILVTGITPQQTITDGITEAEFLELFHKQVVSPDTIFVGFNSVRFDDEFMRYLHYRNFYDPYEWQWQDGRAKWDLMDVTRMMRALRPKGIKWPVQNGKSTNRLELLTKENKISHEGAHDALADVLALIDLAKLIKQAQPKLFDFLLNIMTSKNSIAKLISENDPFLYTSGKYPSEYEKTTAVGLVAEHPKRQAILVFDLKFDPMKYVDLSVDELVKVWRPVDIDDDRLPIKTLQFNRCPAIAPLSVLDEASQKRISLTTSDIEINYANLQKIKIDFSKKILQALDVLDKAQESKYSILDSPVDAQLYDGFFGDKDKKSMNMVRVANAQDLDGLDFKFDDNRLTKLLPLYKARNYPKALSSEEAEAWEKYRTDYLLSGNDSSRLAKFFYQLEELSKDATLEKNKRFLIDELKLYGESIMPTQDY